MADDSDHNRLLAVAEKWRVLYEERGEVIFRLDAENARLKSALDTLIDALLFYADAETYFAIAFWPDSPAGEFMDDFDEDNNMQVYKPGKRARDAFRALPDGFVAEIDSWAAAGTGPTEARE